LRLLAAALVVPIYSIFRGKIGAVDRHLQQEWRLILIESVEDIRNKVFKRRRKNDEQIKGSALQTIVDKIIEILKLTTEFILSSNASSHSTFNDMVDPRVEH
jgi:predicted glycosyltransferase